MPCTFTGSIEGDQALAASGLATALTQLLCQTCKILEEYGIVDMGVIESEEDPNNLVHKINLGDWWENHKKLDAERKAKEKAKLPPPSPEVEEMFWDWYNLQADNISNKAMLQILHKDAIERADKLGIPYVQHADLLLLRKL